MKPCQILLFSAPLGAASSASLPSTFPGVLRNPGRLAGQTNRSNSIEWLNGTQQTIEWVWRDGRIIGAYRVKVVREDFKIGLVRGLQVYTKQDDEPEVSQFLWEVNANSFDVNTPGSPKYYFHLEASAGREHGYFDSSYFLITHGTLTEGSSVPTSFVTFSDSASTNASIESVPTSPSSTALVPSSESLPPKSSSPTASSSASQKNKTPIALGAGVGVGVPLLILVGVVIGMKLVGIRQRRLAAKLAATHPEMRNSVATMANDVPELVLPAEIPTAPKPGELASL